MFRFEELEIWKLSIEYGNELYDIASKFPDEEKYALSDQLRRAAVSISNNIAEGSGGTNKEFCNYLNKSIGSTLETVNILCVAKLRNFIIEENRIKLYNKAETIIRKTRSFKKSISVS